MKNKIILGDAFEEMKKLDDESIDLIITDPPFGINHVSFKGLVAEWDKGVYFKDLMIKLDKEFMRLLKPGRYYFSYIPRKELTKIGNYIDDCNIFVFLKNFSGHWVRGHISYNFIPIIYKSKGVPRSGVKGCKNYFLLDTSNTHDKTYKNPRNIPHPSPKSVISIEHLVKHISLEGDLVLDPFVGSGTTAIACKKLGRKYMGIDSNEEYIQMTNKRLKNTGAQKSLFNTLH